MTLFLAEAAQEAHASVRADWFDWAIVVTLIPALAFIYQLLVSRNNRQLTPKHAALLAIPPLALAVLTFGFVLLKHGSDAATEFAAGFTVEITLSFDNVFAWFLIVSAFVLWRGYQMRLVVWGVAIAIVLRVTVLTVGQGIVTAFWPVSVLLFLLLVKLGWGFVQSIRNPEDDDVNPEDTRLYKLVTRVIPVAESRYGEHLFTKEEGYREFKLFGRALYRQGKITVFGLAVACLGGLDLLFAFDSIPAILAIAHDPFIIISSNVLAVLFLQSLYFLYESLEQYLTRIAYVLPLIMFFVAGKILVGCPLFDWLGEHLSWWKIPTYEISPVLSIEVIFGLLVVGAVWSWLQPVKDDNADAPSEPARASVAG